MGSALRQHWGWRLATSSPTSPALPSPSIRSAALLVCSGRLKQRPVEVVLQGYVKSCLYACEVWIAASCVVSAMPVYARLPYADEEAWAAQMKARHGHTKKVEVEGARLLRMALSSRHAVLCARSVSYSKARAGEINQGYGTCCPGLLLWHAGACMHSCPGRCALLTPCLRGQPLAAGVVPRGRVFPFAMRLTSDVLADDGAAAMTAVGSATLAFASAGIPLSAPVAGAEPCLSLLGQ